MGRMTLFAGLLLLIAPIAWGVDWDFTDTLDDWEATGWQERAAREVREDSTITKYTRTTGCG